MSPFHRRPVTSAMSTVKNDFRLRSGQSSSQAVQSHHGEKRGGKIDEHNASPFFESRRLTQLFDARRQFQVWYAIALRGLGQS